MWNFERLLIKQRTTTNSNSNNLNPRYTRKKVEIFWTAYKFCEQHTYLSSLASHLKQLVTCTSTSQKTHATYYIYKKNKKKCISIKLCGHAKHQNNFWKITYIIAQCLIFKITPCANEWEEYLKIQISNFYMLYYLTKLWWYKIYFRNDFHFGQNIFDFSILLHLSI